MNRLLPARLRQALFLLLLMVSPLAASAQSSINADVNGDGEVTIADVNCTIDAILLNSGDTSADVNGDGEVTIADVNAVIDIILNGQETPAVVHVYGDDGPTEGNVINVTEGKVTVTCQSGTEPKPGEIIVSGITANAPVGFLRRVESVQTSGGQCVMTTSNASLEEVLPDGDYDLPVPMQEQDQYVTIQAPGQAPQRVGFSTSLKVGVKIGWNEGHPIIKLISDVSSADESDVLDGKEDKIYPVKFIARVKPSIDVNFFCSRRNSHIERIGLKGNAGLSVELLGKISIENKPLHLLGEDGIKLFTIHLKPVTVMVGYVPVVFTPRIDVFLTIDMSGEVYLQSKFVVAKVEGEFRYVYTRMPDPLTGQNHNFTTNFSCSCLGDDQLSERMKKAFASKLGLKGTITAALNQKLCASLYGADDIFSVGVPISPKIKAEGNLALELGKDMELDYDDQILIKGSVDMGLESKFKLRKKEFKFTKDITLIETELLDPIGITPRFENLMVSPDSPMPFDTKQVRFSMDMTKPIYQLLSDEDYGFTYGLADDSHDNWTFVSKKADYDDDFTLLNQTQYIESYIDASNLLKDTTYRMCPYVIILGTKIYKKGTSFSFEKEDEGDWVDLGLPSGTLWATGNVVASSPEEYGDYFAWGETTPKEVYNWGTYKWCNGGYNTMTKYCDRSYYGFVDNKRELDPEDDAACVHYPGGRMPSLEQMLELLNKCTWQSTQRNGVNGQLVTGPNGNTLFLPAAGYRWDGSHYNAGSSGDYWSRTLVTYHSDGAYGLGVGSDRSCGHRLRGRGLSVRAVRFP